jgi:mRNA deadenylase 3'-5' endonuclease subunit Ccr4
MIVRLPFLFCADRIHRIIVNGKGWLSTSPFSTLRSISLFTIDDNSTTTASAMRNNTEKIVNYRGRIVLTPDQTGIRKRPDRSTEKEIDPTTVSAKQEGFGPFYYHPQHDSDHRLTTTEWCLSFANPPPLPIDDDSNQNLLTLYSRTPSSYLNADVYTYNDHTRLPTTTLATRKHGYFQLHRNAQEPVGDTLRRLVLRYLQQRAAQPRHQHHRKKKHSTIEESIPPPSQESDKDHTLPRIQIWRRRKVIFHPSDAQQPQEEGDEDNEEVDATQLTNWDFCQLGWQSSLVVSITDGDVDNPKEENHTNWENSSSHRFLLECYPPTVYSVSTFDYWGSCLFVGVPVLIQVETVYATHSRVDWYVDGQLYQTTWNSKHMYTPLAEHVNKKVTLLIVPCRIIPSSSSQYAFSHTGLGCEKAYRFYKLVAPLPVQTVLQMRANWLMQKDSPLSIPDTSRRRTIRVMTYNILADTNAQCFQGFNYPHVTKEMLAKGRRLPLIIHEILQSQADVVCLQEVDFTVYETLLLPVLLLFNFQGYYSGKKGETSNEGCALFWSLSTFAPVSPDDQKTYAIKDLLMRGNGTDDEEWAPVFETLWSLLLHRPDLQLVLATKLAHIAQMVPLTLLNDPSASSASSTTIWITNTHLYYHPQASHVRLLQMLLLARQMTTELRRRPGEIILCGDFNSSLEHSAGKLILDRSVPANFRESQVHLNTFRDRSVTSTLADLDEPETEDDFPSFTLPSSFPVMHSGMQPSPSFTHCSHDFCGTLDHILFSSSGKLRYRSSAPMPSMAEVGSALPSPQVPSDHVSVICELELLDGPGTAIVPDATATMEATTE